MIEIARIVLAALVAQTHIWSWNATWMGWQAVFAFYTLSGYLMTRVLNTRYGFTWQGKTAFAINRTEKQRLRHKQHRRAEVADASTTIQR